MASFQEVGHTADLALRVEGADLATLFATAARGMYHLMGCTAEDDARPVTREITLEAPDVETLLVDWLGELLYLFDVHAECLNDCEVLVVERGRLRARVRGYAEATAQRGIKAVTYSGLRITETPEGCLATVTFDV